MSMNKNNNKIITDQRLFFNLNANKKSKNPYLNKLFTQYANQIQTVAFTWLKNSKTILDYGCGTGPSIDLFLGNKNPGNYQIVGVDIAENSIKQARKKYPLYKFYTIRNNKVPQVKNNSIDAVIMAHILHHSHNHSDIFKEIHSKLKNGGRFLIMDLSSGNPFVQLGRLLFVHLPMSIKNKFSDDLVIDGRIPEKYKINISDVVFKLEKIGFSIEKIEYGHLFFFLFGWLDKFFPFSDNKIINSIYKSLINFEGFLLKFEFFRSQAEMLVIRCYKKN